jgi:hypothetical protein
VDAGSADVILDHVVIHHVTGHAVSSNAGGRLRAVHCTIASNGGDGLRASGLSTVRHCIVVKNAGTGLNLAAGADAEYNDVFQNTVANYGAGITGNGNISVPAAFLNEAASDYRDASASPTVDAGDPADPVGSEPAPNGGRINQGVTGGTVWAATTPQAVPWGGGGHKKRCGLLGPELLLPLLWLRFRGRSPRARR